MYQAIPKSLVISLVVVVLDVLAHSPTKVALVLSQYSAEAYAARR